VFTCKNCHFNVQFQEVSQPLAVELTFSSTGGWGGKETLLLYTNIADICIPCLALTLGTESKPEHLRCLEVSGSDFDSVRVKMSLVDVMI